MNNLIETKPSKSQEAVIVNPTDTPTVDLLETSAPTLLGAGLALFGVYLADVLNRRKEIRAREEKNKDLCKVLQFKLFAQFNHLACVFDQQYKSFKDHPERHKAVQPTKGQTEMHEFKSDDYPFLLHTSDAMLFADVMLSQTKFRTIIDACQVRDEIHFKIQEIVCEETPNPPDHMEFQIRMYTDQLYNLIPDYLSFTKDVMTRLTDFLTRRYGEGFIRVVE